MGSEEATCLPTERAASSDGQLVLVADSGAIDHATWALYRVQLSETTADERAHFQAWKK